MTNITGNKNVLEMPLTRASEPHYRQSDIQPTVMPTVDRQRLWQLQPQAEMTKQLWEPKLAAIERLPIQRLLTRETTAAAFQHHTEIHNACMVIQLASSAGPSIGGVPLDLVQRLVTFDAVNKTLLSESESGQSTQTNRIVIVGHSLAEAAKPQMSMAEREQVGRLAFATLRLIDRLREYGVKIEGVLDTDLVNDQKYLDTRKDLQPLAAKTYAQAFDEACLIEAARRIYSPPDGPPAPMIVAGWSSFEKMADFEAIKQGTSENKTWVRNCSIHSYKVLEAAAAQDFAMVVMEAGRSILGPTRPANPDLITPISQYGSLGINEPMNQEQYRVLLNRDEPEKLRECFRDPVGADRKEITALIQLQAYYTKLFTQLEQTLPGILPQLDQETAILRVSENILKACNVAAKADPENPVLHADLWQAIAVAARDRNPIIIENIRAVVYELGGSFAQVFTNPTRANIPALTPGLAERGSSLTVDEESFKDSRTTHRATRSLNVPFRRAESAQSTHMIQKDAPLDPAVYDSSDTPPGDGDGDDEKSFAA